MVTIVLFTFPVLLFFIGIIRYFLSITLQHCVNRLNISNNKQVMKKHGFNHFKVLVYHIISVNCFIEESEEFSPVHDSYNESDLRTVHKVVYYLQTVGMVITRKENNPA